MLTSDLVKGVKEMVMKSTGDSIIDSTNAYLDLLPEEQLQEVFKFTQNAFITMLLKKISSLPANKRREVFEFIEYLLEKTTNQKTTH